jgi:hypothetical protein
VNLLEKIIEQVNTNLKRRQSYENRMGHKPTPQKHSGKRGRGFTKSAHDDRKAKARRKIAAKSRRINRRKR